VAEVASFAARVCAAAVTGLAGRLAPAYEALQVLAAEAARHSPGERAWLAAERAEAAERLGRAADAEAIYRDALREFPEDWQLRAAFADFLLDAGRAGEAADLVRGRERSDALLLRALLAQRALGRGDAGLQARVADAFAAARRRGEDLHLREEARYALEVLGDVSRGLELASRNWEVQREPWDARLLLAAAHAAGRPHAADPVREWMRATGFEDARITAQRRGEVW
jgi:predicted Zn-dependent protease